MNRNCLALFAWILIVIPGHAFADLVIENFEEGDVSVSDDTDPGPGTQVNSGLNTFNNIGTYRVTTIATSSGASASANLTTTALDDSLVFQLDGNTDSFMRFQMFVNDPNNAQGFVDLTSGGDQFRLNVSNVDFAPVVRLRIESSNDGASNYSFVVNAIGDYDIPFSNFVGFNSFDMISQVEVIVDHNNTQATPVTIAFSDLSVVSSIPEPQFLGLLFASMALVFAACRATKSNRETS